MRLALADSFGQSTERRGRIQLTRPPPLILISIPARIHPARKFVMNVPLCQRQAATNPRDLSRRPQDGVVTSVNLLFCVLKNDPQLNSLQRTKPLGGFPAGKMARSSSAPGLFSRLSSAASAGDKLFHHFESTNLAADEMLSAATRHCCHFIQMFT